jgi:hypothetical protein
MMILQIIGIVILAIGLVLLYLEIGGKKVIESKWLGMSGPVGLVLMAVGVILAIVG